MKKKKRRRSGFGPMYTVMLCLFCFTFVCCAAMYGFDQWNKERAADAYGELQTVAQKAMTPGETLPEEGAEEKDTGESPPVCMDFTELQAVNPEIVGWLCADGGIDYPVTRTGNNDYYLYHLYNGKYNSGGSIFMDCQNAPDCSDGNTVLYGHHMKNGTMFASLEEYRRQEYYDAHPTMTFYTPDATYRIELLSGTLEDGTEHFLSLWFANDEAMQTYVQRFQARSTFRTQAALEPGDRLISLCTCAYDTDNARYVLIGRLVPIWEK